MTYKSTSPTARNPASSSVLYHHLSCKGKSTVTWQKCIDNRRDYDIRLIMASSVVIRQAANVIVLELINLVTQSDFHELLRQCILCGWVNTKREIESWRVSADRNTKSLFRIVPTVSLRESNTRVIRGAYCNLESSKPT